MKNASWILCVLVSGCTQPLQEGNPNVTTDSSEFSKEIIVNRKPSSSLCGIDFQTTWNEEVEFNDPFDTVVQNGVTAIFFNVKGDLPAGLLEMLDFNRNSCIIERGNHFDTLNVMLDGRIKNKRDEYLAYQIGDGFDTLKKRPILGEAAYNAVFMAHIDSIKSYLIAEWFWEGLNYLVINESGEKASSGSIPTFNQDWTKFVDAGSLLAHEVSSWIVIKHKTGNSYEPFVRINIPFNDKHFWSPTNPVWLNDSTLIFRRDDMHESGDYIGMTVQRN